MRVIFILSFLFLSISLFSQELKIETTKHKKKRFFLYWGYNRGVYGKSDISYHGPGYKFTLTDVEAIDIPEPFDPKIYLKWNKLTIPQFNMRAGFHWKNNIYFTAGWDHMKYQSVNGQKVIMDGYVDSTFSEQYAGIYDNREVDLNHSFIRMEHSDGFNLVKINIEKHFDFIATKKEQIALTGVVGTGPIFPLTWTNAILLGKHNDDRPHFSGLGISATAGAKVTFFKHLFLQFNLDVGYVNSWDITPRPKGDPGRASQKIKYFQRMALIGYAFNFVRDK